MTDPLSIDSKKKEVEEIFASVGFSFQQFDPEAFEKACQQLDQEPDKEVHARLEPPVARAKLVIDEGKHYQILYDGTLQVS